MKVSLSELRRIYEPAVKASHNGACSRLVNELLGEPLFLALCADCLSKHSGREWNYSVGEARGLKIDGKRSTSKWLDGFVFSDLPHSGIPPLIACEVKGWSDNSLGGYAAAPEKRRSSKPRLSRGEFYWSVIPNGLSRMPPGALYKLDQHWHPPSSVLPRSECAVSVIMYHLIDPPASEGRVEWPLDGTRSMFWFSTPEFDVHRRVLIFSVAKYIQESGMDEFEFHDNTVEKKVAALRRLGVVS